jgi:hypothetical protein
MTNYQQNHLHSQILDDSIIIYLPNSLSTSYQYWLTGIPSFDKI